MTDRSAAPPYPRRRLGRRTRLAVAGSFAGLLTAALVLAPLLLAPPTAPAPAAPRRASAAAPDPRPAFYRSLADDFAAAARGERG